MRYLYIPFLLLIMAGACKKKNDKPYVTMTVTINGDSSWTTTDVSTYATGTAVSLSATNPVTHDRVKLGMFDFREGHKTYEIDYRAVGGNINGNTASYEYPGHVALGSVGSISITEFTTKTMKGSFEFSGPDGGFTGTFIAPKP